MATNECQWKLFKQLRNVDKFTHSEYRLNARATLTIIAN